MEVAGGTQVESDRGAYVALSVPADQFPGILGLFQTWPDTGRVLSELAEVLLRSPHSLTRGERELIAAYVSVLTECKFCCGSHSAFAAALTAGGISIVEQVVSGHDDAPVSEKLRSLLVLAGAVQKSGRNVKPELIDAVRAQGATDDEI